MDSLVETRLAKLMFRFKNCELLSNLVFEDCWSCGDLVGFGFNSVFECGACDDFGEVVKAA